MSIDENDVTVHDGRRVVHADHLVWSDDVVTDHSGTYVSVLGRYDNTVRPMIHFGTNYGVGRPVREDQAGQYFEEYARLLASTNTPDIQFDDRFGTQPYYYVKDGRVYVGVSEHMEESDFREAMHRWHLGRSEARPGYDAVETLAHSERGDVAVTIRRSDADGPERERPVIELAYRDPDDDETRAFTAHGQRDLLGYGPDTLDDRAKQWAKDAHALYDITDNDALPDRLQRFHRECLEIRTINDPNTSSRQEESSSGLSP